MARQILAWLVALVATFQAAPANACSLSADYVRPSNFEMVQLAEAIAVATPIRRAGGFALVFRIELAIKGAPPRTVSVNFAGFGPDSIGMCSRAGFERGRRYLLFLGRDSEGQWDRIGYGGAADSPDYDGERGEWTRTIRRYLGLQRDLQPMEQLAALRHMAESGRDRDGTTLTAAERFDIVDHLSAITPWKPTGWLLDLYGRLERGEPLPFPPRPDGSEDAADLERAVAAFLAPAAAATPEVRAEMEMQVLRALALGEHPEALPLFERLVATPRLDGGRRGLTLRYLANHGNYDRAWRWIEDRLLAELPLLPAEQVPVLLREVQEVQRGDSFDEGAERWRTSREAARAWPELALALHWYQVRTFDRPDDRITFSGALAAIPLSDYRSRPELTIALAAEYDEGVERWAIAELQRPTRAARLRDELGNPAMIQGDEPDLLPLRALVTAWSADKEPLLVRAFCDGGERRRLVIHAIGQWGDGLFGSLLDEFATFGGLTDDERSWLFRAAVEVAAREIRENGSTGLIPDDESEWLVSRLARGEAPGARATICPTQGMRAPR